VRRFECGEFHGEGLLTFFNGDDKPLFKFYRIAGAFSTAIMSLSGDLGAAAADKQRPREI
jgi:hypothetical protein